MNAVEIEEAVSDLAAAPFDAAEFAFRFLTAFGIKEVTIKRLRSRSSNLSDVAGGVLQRNNIHLATALGRLNGYVQRLQWLSHARVSTVSQSAWIRLYGFERSQIDSDAMAPTTTNRFEHFLG